MKKKKWQPTSILSPPDVFLFRIFTNVYEEKQITYTEDKHSYKETQFNNYTKITNRNNFTINTSLFKHHFATHLTHIHSSIKQSSKSVQNLKQTILHDD